MRQVPAWIDESGGVHLCQKEAAKADARIELARRIDTLLGDADLPEAHADIVRDFLLAHGKAAAEIENEYRQTLKDLL